MWEAHRSATQDNQAKAEEGAALKKAGEGNLDVPPHGGPRCWAHLKPLQFGKRISERRSCVLWLTWGDRIPQLTVCPLLSASSQHALGCERVCFSVSGTSGARVHAGVCAGKRQVGGWLEEKGDLAGRGLDPSALSGKCLRHISTSGVWAGGDLWVRCLPR